MNEFFTEHLVKRRNTSATTWKKIGLVLATVILMFLAFTFLFSIAMFITAGLIFLDVFLFRRMNVEFEYTYYNGDMDIDKIMNMQSRKRILSMNIKDMEILAPSGSVELQPFQRLKVLDVSSQEPDHKTYELVIPHKGEMMRIIFEPNEVILNGMKYLAPRKVFF